MEPEPDVWDTGMAAAQQYFDDQGHLNVPSNYIDAAGFHLGCWLGYQRALKLAGNLNPARTAALATCR
ncbi:helicase associated domain-containing protein [Streptomyces griseoviridis]|nr:helicase associated domain-containing protein [Streptomyces griseoviridis]